VINAVIDSVQQVFPSWATLDATHRGAALRFTAALQTWAAAERARDATMRTYKRNLATSPGVYFGRDNWPHGRTGSAVPHGAVFARP